MHPWSICTLEQVSEDDELSNELGTGEFFGNHISETTNEILGDTMLSGRVVGSPL